MYRICNISNTCMVSCHHVTITYTLVGEILDLSQNSVDFAPRGPVVILNVAV